MTITQFTIDSFTDKVFGGNPAAVCLLTEPLSDELMQKIAIENNLSETAFVLPENGAFRLRWFTPAAEIDLCGHATLATAFALQLVNPQQKHWEFNTLSGILTVSEENGWFSMNFPAYKLSTVPMNDLVKEALGDIEPKELWLGRDLVCVLENEEQVRKCVPNWDKMKQLEGLLCHITAQGTDYDIVSRSFAPKLGVNEDPVCGSGHCHLFPYWEKRLGKNQIVGYQASERGGVLLCECVDNRVTLKGQAVLFAKSKIYV